MPYNWLFELLGAVVEVFGYFIIPFSLIMGELNIFFFCNVFSHGINAWNYDFFWRTYIGTVHKKEA